MIVDKLKYLLELDSSGFNANAKSSDQKVNQLTNSISRKLTTALAGLASGYMAIKGIKFASELAGQAAQAEKVSSAYSNMTEQFGQSGDNLLNNLKSMSKGTISEVQAMTQASRAMVMQIPNEDLPRLMEIARAASKAFGQDTNFMFESIVLGIARQSRLILDNLGIIISEERVYKEEAKRLGHALNDTEKQQAFLNEALRQGQRIIDLTGADVVQTSDKYQRFSASLDNTKVSAGNLFNAIANNTGLLDVSITVIEGLGDAFDKLSGNVDDAKKSIEELYNLTRVESSDIEGDIAQLEEEQRKQVVITANNWKNVKKVIDKNKLSLEELKNAYYSGALAESELSNELYKSIEAYIIASNKIAILQTKILELKSNFDETVEAERDFVLELKNINKELEKLTRILSGKAGALFYGIRGGNIRSGMLEPLSAKGIKPLIPEFDFEEISGEWEEFWYNLSVTIGVEGVGMVQGAFQRLIWEIDGFARNLIDIGISIAEGDWVSVGANILGSFIDVFADNRDIVEENRRAFEDLRLEMERIISTAPSLSDALLEAEIARLEWLLEHYQVGFYDEYAPMREALRDLRDELTDRGTIRGIESFGELVNYLQGADDITFQQGRRLIDYFVEMFGLTTEQQMVLYELLGETITDASNWNNDAWMQFNEILHNLQDSRLLDLTTPDQSQIYRSITTITERQANTMQAVLNSQLAEARVQTGLLASIRNYLKNAGGNIITSSPGGESIAPAPVNVSSTFESLDRSFRNSGWRV